MTINETNAYPDLAANISESLFSEAQLAARIKELGEEISRDYRDRYPMIVGVLKGVVFFIADLLRAIRVPIELDFIAVSSYSPETRDKGIVRLVKDLEIPINGRHVLFVEDVVDTGLTLNYLLQNLRSRDPASLEVCTLFNKPRRRLIDLPLKYVGFELPDRFVVGYGLDYRERYRNLPYVGLLNLSSLNKSRGPE
jgi:hypoxanthine phosphoribosyltransferase